MGGPLFDVFVVGSTDPSPAGETRLASALAGRHGVPLAAIAKAISAKNLRAGQGLGQADAQALVRQLQGMGAVTVIRPASSPTGSQSVTSSTGNTAALRTSSVNLSPLSAAPQSAGLRASSVALPCMPPQPTNTLRMPSMGSPAPAAATRQTQAPGPSAQSSDPWPMLGSPGAPLGVPVALPTEMTTGVPAGAATFAHSAGIPANIGTPLRATVSPAPSAASSMSPSVSRMTPPVSAAPVAAPAMTPARMRATSTLAAASTQGIPQADGFPMEASGPKLELARPGRETPGDRQAMLEPSRTPTPVGNLRDIDADKASGVSVDDDPKNLNLIRCAQHGLYYDKTKASGCRKCMSAAREFSMGYQVRNTKEPFRLGNFHDQPMKRAFAGLAFAVTVGLIPSAYYSLGPGRADARELRVEQEVLSRQPGTEEILRRFDELEQLVSRSHERSLRYTGIMWVAVAMAAMAGWYKIT